jgi:hypothetical protein
MIILDLEWNRSYDKKALDEILQIGAVKLDYLGGPITSQFNAFIRPRIHKRFDPGARKLPDLRESLDSDLSFAEAWAAFTAWREGEDCFAFWGRGDFDTLRRSCEYWGVPCEEPATVYDLQLAFAHACGADRQQMALLRVVDYLGIPDLFDYHNALNDAMYTALVTAWLRLEDVEYKPEKHRTPRRRRRKNEPFCALPFGKDKGRRTGTYPGVGALLAARESRRQKCPLCGNAMWVRDWRIADPLHYYSAVRCEKHGRFVCRLTAAPVGDGELWRGHTAVPPVTPELLRCYDRAKPVPRGD